MISPNVPVDDPTMPFLSLALDPDEVRWRFSRSSGFDDEILPRSARVIRHKPGKRALVEYELESPTETFTVIGKARARGVDDKSYRVQRDLEKVGFPVPRTLGKIPEFHMWLQRKEPGVPATELLAGPDGVGLARRIADLSHSLHGAGVTPLRPPHGMAEELKILHERLPLVAEANPDRRHRIERILCACDRLGASLPAPKLVPIHRDFYADQVLVDGERIRLLDFDLYCEGDPGLDIGNFAAHLTEQALRTLGNPDALKDREEALVESFVELSGEEVLRAVRVYSALTLARHVHISFRIPERGPLTEDILDLCEERLPHALRDIA
ncbi:MAG: phosphotransferase family protein [Rubrobacteraceae bacterium]